MQDGRALFEQARFDEALAWFEAVLDDPEAEVQMISTAHLYLSALGLVNDDSASARIHAAAAIALDDEATSPPGAPRRLEELLADARAARPVGGLTLRIEAPSCGAVGTPFSVRAIVAGAPTDLVRSVRLQCSDGDHAVAAESATAAEVEIDGTAAPSDGLLTCIASALSRSGAELRAASLEVPSCPAEPPSPRDVAAEQALADSPVDSPAPDVADAQGGQGRVWLWVGLAAGAAVVVAAVITGVLLGTASRELSVGPIRVEGP